MTIRDREVVDLLRHDPELLAIADAVADAQRPPRRLNGGRAVAAIVVVAVGLFALVLASPWDRGSGKGFVLERALAAITDRGPVLHAVFVSPGGAVYTRDPVPNVRLNLKTGASRLIEDREEVWYDRKRNLVRFLTRRDGHVLSDYVEKGAVGEGADPFSQFAGGTFYRDALAEGRATVVGNGSWHGHAVYWLELHRAHERLDRRFPFQYGIDQDSYRLLVTREVSPEGHPTGRETGVLLFEYLPRAEGQFESKQTDEGGFAFNPPDVITLAKARTALGVRAAWVGPSLDGLPLQTITLTEVCPSKGCPPERRHESKGGLLDLLYVSSRDLPNRGIRLSPGPTGVLITEAPAGARRITRIYPVVSAIPPPAGFADLSYLGKVFPDKRPTWAALVAVGDVWVHIDAPSRELAIAAARALRPIPPRAR
jgi:hypothetical protein